MILLILVLSCFYALLNLILFIGLRKLGKQSPPIPTQASAPTVSVLIAARNEEAHLPALFAALAAQDYAGEWEICIANDRSSDRSAEFMHTFANAHPQRVRILHIEQVAHGLSPKKNALTQLVSMSQGEILLLTDADCAPPSTWIRHMVEHFRPGVDWVSGYSFFPKRPHLSATLEGVQALDFLSHRTIDAAAVGLGMPITACGQNLAYRKSIFTELNGFVGLDTITSGDDDLLMHKLAAIRPRSIQYCTHAGTFVPSQGAYSWNHAWEQRKRWASKTIHYNVSSLLILAPVFLYYTLISITILLGLMQLIWDSQYHLLLVGASTWLWKTAWDVLVMAKGMQIFHASHLRKWFPLTSVLHIPVILGAVAAGLCGRFRWKG